MFDASIQIRPLSERKAMQQQYGAHTLPLQDLCYAMYTTIQTGEPMIVDVIATDETESQAILSYRDEERGERVIWHAYRDQEGAPGTWLWTPQQQEEARQNPIRIDDAENEFADDEEADRPIQVAPIHPDRRVEILMLGLRFGLSDAEVQEQLRAEGFDETLPANYRTAQGELATLKNWLPKPDETTEPLTRRQPGTATKALTFSRKTRVKGQGKKRRR